jgi:hypothetical protein
MRKNEIRILLEKALLEGGKMAYALYEYGGRNKKAPVF